MNVKERSPRKRQRRERKKGNEKGRYEMEEKKRGRKEESQKERNEGRWACAGGKMLLAVVGGRRKEGYLRLVPKTRLLH